MNMRLTKDSQGILLLTSSMGLPRDNNELRPLSFSEWNSLAEKLANSSLERPSAFFQSEPKEWKEILNLNDALVDRMQRLLARGAAMSMEIERLNNLGIWITTRAESTYPSRLKKILKRKSPLFLFGAGDYRLASGGVAIVGSRDVDQEGSVFTANLAKKCVAEGLTIVSGGARGVDTIAQDTALTHGGNAVSILSNGLEQAIRKKDTRNNILDNRFLLLSPFHPKVPFRVYNAMDRNKYVYALAHYAVVISATEKKGGTWAGAIENLKSNWVPLYVRSDISCPQGNQALVNEGGIPLNEKVFSQNVSIKDWFDRNKNSEVGGNDLATTNTHSIWVNVQEDFDLFPIVLPYLCNALQAAKNTQELAKLLHVEDSQVELWLERAHKEGLVSMLKSQGNYKGNLDPENSDFVHEQISFF